MKVSRCKMGNVCEGEGTVTLQGVEEKQGGGLQGQRSISVESGKEVKKM